MILSVITLLAVSVETEPETAYPHDPGWGCIVYATLADSGGTGSSSMAAWNGLESWCGGFIGTPPPIIVSAELFLQGINQDKVRAWSIEDMAGTFRLLDGNSDGVIEKGEITAASLAGEAPVLAQAFVRRTARLLLLETADADRNGVVSVQERADILKVWTQAEYKSKLVRVWINTAKQDPDARWSSISPGASFAAFEANLDEQEQHGHRIDWLWMEGWFHVRDANKDNVLDAKELYASCPTERIALPPLTVAREARAVLRRGDVDGAVQRLIGLAWLSPESFASAVPGEVSAMDTAREVLAVALPAESQPMVNAFRVLGIPLSE